MTSTLACTLVLGLVACSGDERDFDAGEGPVDASTVADASEGSTVDAGAGEDAGTEDDAGIVADAGVDTDAGVVTAGPIDAPADTWTWVDFPDAKCINGTSTGIGVNLHPGATKALVFLMGGNACFNQSSCFTTANLDGYGRSKFESDFSNAGAIGFLDRTEAQNIFADYHFVFVPYCTGDVHAGSNPNGNVAGSRYSFVGYDNIGEYLERLVPTFSGVTEVVLSGASAGGFGAMLNFEQFQTAFGDQVRVTLVDDSGPPMSSAYIAGCLQAHFRETWGYDTGVLASCAGCLASTDGSFIEPYFDHLMGLYPDRNFAVISSDGDETIRTFWGFGQNECRNLNDFLPPAYPAAMYAAGLANFRDELSAGLDNVGLYLKTNSTRHVWLAPDPIWTITQDGVTLSDWLAGAIGDDPSWTDVPAGN